ncbi:FG-GAP repeat domain-containing protein [Streptomyces sp. NPDC056144]|uniref:FG-GAP repeat domain-containing protein n=1 Tax=unclassified Streptomyces TaxID=2593676 RepID=UPI0035E012C3
MAKSSRLNRTSVLSRVTVAAVTAALLGTTTAAVAADAPKPTLASTKQATSGASAFSADAATARAQVNYLQGVNSAGIIWRYEPVGGGAIQRLASSSGSGWQYDKHFSQADLDGNGSANGIYTVNAGRLLYTPYGGSPRFIANGWGGYNEVLSAGNTGGGVADDILARDSSGVLWHYLAYGNGSLTGRKRVGAGWNQYTQIAGKGDITGDGRADVVAKDRNGYLWLYKGTGSHSAPFTGRVRIGTGWNWFNLLVSPGDLNFDGLADLVARDKDGGLWLYPGRGSSTSPFSPRKKIGNSGWNSFREMF